MCGIFTIMNVKGKEQELRKTALHQVKKIRHRGPDWSGIYADKMAILAHERLSIVDIEHGAQPLIHPSEGTVLAVNGEIYNHQELRKGLKGNPPFQTLSDCEVILHLYKEEGAGFLNKLNGIFAFVLHDPKRKSYFIARDPMGVIPLYWGRDKNGRIYVSSEMKALIEVCVDFTEFPPGHYYVGSHKKVANPLKTGPVPYYRPAWALGTPIPDKKVDLQQLREALEAAVKRQLMCDVPYGVLLSGGLDSSLIAAITKKFFARRVEDSGATPAWWPQLHSFSVGLEGAPDLIAAQKVAKFLGTIHHEIHFTVQEGLDALSDVIYHLETFDVTTIRAATPMYLMTRKIKAMGIKMVLSGEGSDEIFGGYLYFHKAPSPQELHLETIRKLNWLYKYDCLRANKSTASWGVEARVPFLDVEFLEVAMNIDPADKMITKDRMEKYILRKAFEGYLPPEILWRQKEQFSDGVGYSWIDGLKKHVATEVTDRQLALAKRKFPDGTPATKEAYFYRQIFAKHFPGSLASSCIPSGPSVACSSPTAFLWDKAFALLNDPSGRAVKDVHVKAYK